jgi:hypothetical protein
MLGASRATSTREYQLIDTGTITSTGSQSYTIPAGTLYLEIEMWAGGGGGAMGRDVSGRGGSHTYYRGGAGGGGSYIKHIYYGAADMLANDTLNFTVGAGGAKSTGLTDSGDNGGDTTLDTHKRSTTVITTFTVDAGGGGGGRRPSGISSGQPNSEAGTATNEGNTTNTDGVAGEVKTQVLSATGDGGDGGAGGNGGAGGAGASSSGGTSNAGTVPGGGGGGGMPTIKPAGNDGADGKVVVKAYG